MQSRKVFRLSGTDARKFLQGLVTNDVKKLDHGLVYAAMLTPQGKYICDFFLVPEGEHILLDAPAQNADALIKRLSMYRLRADVAIEETSLIVSQGIASKPKGAFDDPRHSALGWRLYGSEDHSEDVDWTAIRVAHCIPEHGLELTPDTFILEASYERLNGVDFRKGCYVGQEVTARMKHKTELRKGYATVSVSHEVPFGTMIQNEDGKEVGQVCSQSGGEAIAYLRFDRTQGNMNAGDATITLK